MRDRIVTQLLIAFWQLIVTQDQINYSASNNNDSISNSNSTSNNNSRSNSNYEKRAYC